MGRDEEAPDRRRMRPSLLAPALLAPRLRHVRWIGGGSGAGKSTVACQLAADHGLRLYRTDDTIAEHARRSRSTDTPLLDAFLAMDMDERWANRSPEVMLKTFPWFAGEGFDLIMEDLLALAENPLVLAEGFRLLPRLVAPLLSRPNQAVWLVPTPAFRRAAFDSREFTWEIPTKTSKPERALSNLLFRDHLFTQEVVKEASALQLRVIEVDGTVSVDEMIRHVANHLDLSAP
jgi:2-phosphoglycerate kinase